MGKWLFYWFSFSWILVISILLLTALPVNASMYRSSPAVSLPDAQNYQFVEPRGTCLTIVTDESGRAWLDSDKLPDGPKGFVMIEDRIEERMSNKSKVFLKADREVKFGKITAILELLSKAGIKVVVFITDEFAAPVDFFKDFKPRKSRVR